jgi:transposase
MTENAKYFIGIDLHKTITQVCVLDRHGEVVEERRFVGGTLEEGAPVIEFLARWTGGLFCVEAVGFNRWLVNACLKAGLEIVVVDPVKLNLRMLGKKTDRRDAYEIARRLLLGDVQRNATTYYPTEDEYGARKLVRTRHQLTSLRQHLVNQVRAVLAAYRIPAPPNQLYRPGALKSLREIRLSNVGVDFAVQSLVSSLEAIQASIVGLSKRIEEATHRESRAELLASLPSVGPLTATTLACELGDLTRFRNSKALASYAGLVPRVANSADKSHHGAITNRGNRELRWILTEWAVRLLSFDPLVKKWAIPRLKRMHRNKVRMTLARRLLVGLYAMFTRGEVFSLQRCLAH